MYNGSGKALDHLIALYGIESPWPPCTNWSDSYSKPLKWTDTNGHIQRSGKPFSVAPGETLTEEILIIVFHGDEPRFADWRVNFTFAEGTSRHRGRAATAAPGYAPCRATDTGASRCAATCTGPGTVIWHQRRGDVRRQTGRERVLAGTGQPAGGLPLEFVPGSELVSHLEWCMRRRTGRGDGGADMGLGQ